MDFYASTNMQHMTLKMALLSLLLVISSTDPAAVDPTQPP